MKKAARPARSPLLKLQLLAFYLKLPEYFLPSVLGPV